MPTRIEVSYLLTTPMFSAATSPDVAELRLPSFKGMLRFWWRALAWSRCQADLALIQQQEERLFGSTRTGQAQVVMRLGSHTPWLQLRKDQCLTVARGDQQVVGMGARYLGYGLMAAFRSQNTNTSAGQLSRAALQAPLAFQVQLRASGLEDGLLTSLLQALIALGTLGGMGARSRKGYGSLVLQALEVDGASAQLGATQPLWAAPRNAGELVGAIAALQKPANRDGLPEFTALSSGARHLVLTAEACDHPLDLLDLVGRELVRFRSWGKGGRVLDGVPSEMKFNRDHDLMKIAIGARRSHPERIAFGLPHNYGRGRENEVAPAGQLDRRASPLLIHIHQCGSRPAAVLSFLPARFLPAGTAISVGGTPIAPKPESELYKPIHAFLNRLLDPQQCKEPFSDVLEVQP